MDDSPAAIADPQRRQVGPRGVTASVKAKAAAASLLHATGAVAWRLGRYPRDAFPILMYHRVIPRSEAGSPLQAGMFVEPETFDLHIRSLVKHFDIVPLRALPLFPESPVPTPTGKHLCALTFDDGWCDFFTYTYPILKRHKVHATVYLPTDFIGTRRWFWTDRLGFLLHRMPDLMRLPGDPGPDPATPAGRIIRMPGSVERRLEEAISLLKSRPLEEIENCLSLLAEALGEHPIPAHRAFLTWGEVSEMEASGLVSFGSHTAGHAILTTLTGAEARRELARSKEVMVFRSIADSRSITFSYPNGNFTGELAGMARSAGYLLAVTTRNGWNAPDEDPFKLKRISIHQDMTSTKAMFLARVAGLI